MPFVFAIVGLGLLVVAIRGTHKQAFALLQSEFTGPQNFVTWALALFVLGALGYIPVIKPVTRALLLLVLLVIFLKNGTGFFAKFQSQIAAPEQPPSAPGVSMTPATMPLATPGYGASAWPGLTPYPASPEAGSSGYAPGAPSTPVWPGSGTPVPSWADVWTRLTTPAR